MTENPIANPDQFAAEEEVRAMLSLPSIKAARAKAEAHWRIGHGEAMPTDQRDALPPAVDEYVANYLFKAAACDTVRPRFVRNFMAPYRWNGTEVPGARMGGDNPDNCYRLAGIAHGGSYVVRLAPIGRDPAHVSFTLVGNWGTSVTIQTLELHLLERAADGSATITIDDRPAAGRPNHMTTAPHVKFLFVRDSLADWANETPLALAIERLDPPGSASPSIEERATRAALRLIEEVPLYYWFHRLSSGRSANVIDPPFCPAGVGGLVTQASAIGRFHLPPDQAAIVKYDPAGAGYAAMSLVSWNYHSIEAHERQSSLAMAMSASAADGSITCVVSARDPGIANWIDTGGLIDTLPLVRWQGLPATQVRDGPQLRCEIVPFDALDARLPTDVARVGGEQRAAQLSARRAAYRRRITI